MKALQLKSYGELPDNLEFANIQKPNVEADDVLIEIYASSINPIDNGLTAGHLKDMIKLDLPVTLGYDLSGTVTEIGSEVKNIKVGDEVYSRVPQEQMGTIAEFINVKEKFVSKKPSNISFEEAAGIPLAGLTAYQCLLAADLKKGEKVLIHAGSGGVGSIAVQIAKSMGAYVYTTTGPTNQEWVDGLGADEVINYKTEDYKKIVKDVDVVFDTLGDDFTIDAFSILKDGGRVVSVKGPMDMASAKAMGIDGYEMPAELAEAIKSKNATYKFVWMNPDGAQLEELKTMIEADKIRPIVDKVYKFDEAIEALQYLENGKAKGKVIIKIK